MPFSSSFPKQDQFYDQLADTWWDEYGVLHLLKSMVNPWRVPYFDNIIRNNLGNKLNAFKLLDLGCGGGLLTEEFFKMGLNIIGIDISPKSIHAAATHAKTANFKINYQIGSASTLPFADHSFDIVSCCDVLEHLPNWELAIKETARVLKPNGLFLFDTINRTPISFLIMILGAEMLPFIKFLPKSTHSWQKFIKPVELQGVLFKNHLACKDITGGKPKTSIIRTAIELLRLNQGKISIKELGDNISLQQDINLGVNYIGYAVKVDTET